jgi:hypothetical protein
MKLSEAIRLGAMMRPQAFSCYTDGIGTCVWGAANEAIGLPANHGFFETEGEWSVADQASRCPIAKCVRRFRVVSSIIQHLNDEHRWTREKIADWVETIEAQHDTPQPAAIEVQVHA